MMDQKAQLEEIDLMQMITINQTLRAIVTLHRNTCQ